MPRIKRFVPNCYKSTLENKTCSFLSVFNKHGWLYRHYLLSTGIKTTENCNPQSRSFVSHHPVKMLRLRIIYEPRWFSIISVYCFPFVKTDSRSNCSFELWDDLTAAKCCAKKAFLIFLSSYFTFLHLSLKTMFSMWRSNSGLLSAHCFPGRWSVSLSVPR